MKYKPVSEGDVFGRLTIVTKDTPHVNRSGQRTTKWRCRCQCGREISARDYHLKTGNTKSCGCLSIDLFKGRATSHGKAHLPEYRVWASMIQRCDNKKDKSWPRYGGIGISVCQEWKASFEVFYNDMGQRPDGTTLDRIDSKGNYEPKNCRWATISQQNHNQKIKKTNTSGYKGVSFNSGNGKWYAQISINGERKYLGCYEKKDEAIKARKKAESDYANQLSQQKG